MTFQEIIDRKNKKQAVSSNQKEDMAFAIQSTRQSIPEDADIASYLSEMALLDPDFNIKVIDAIENLAKYHPDVSRGVENIVNLCNTPYHVYFDGKFSAKAEKEMSERLKAKGKNWYAHSGGVNSLVNDLAAQVIISGALSGECVPEKSLDGIKKVVLVATKTIRFKYDKSKDEYVAHQTPTSTLIDSVKLNPETYSYIAVRRLGEKPYAIPPFLAAICNLSIGNEMNSNLASIVKRLGILGFLEVLVNGPKPLAGEQAEAYYNRTKSYLERIVPEIDKGLSKGYVAGFKDVHEFKMHNTSQNVGGAKDLIEINDTKMMSGLKQDPFLFGRNFSTTETLGRVILAIMGAQVANYQKIIASFLEKLFLLDLQLAGYPVKSLSVVFDKAMVGDVVREETAFGMKIDNLTKLYNQGIISQNQFATEMDYDTPDEEGPRNLTPETEDEGDPDTDDEEDAVDDKDATDPETTENKKLLSNSELALLVEAYKPFAKVPTYDYMYAATCGCCPVKVDYDTFAKPNDKLASFAKKYFTASKNIYSAAVDTMTGRVAKALLGMSDGVSEEYIVNTIMLTMFSDWETVYTNRQKKVINSFVQTIYTFFREDKSVFGSKTKDAPDATFKQIDYRAIDYYKNSDEVYLGKFITDDDVRKDITKYIKEQYLTRNLPIGGNKEALADFKNQFAGVLNGQDWKISQIINTTVSRMRNSAAVSYFDQAEVLEFEIRGVNDSMQCDYCKNLQGKTFTLKRTMEALDQTYSASPETVKVDTPFITSIFKKPDEMKDLTGSELQDKNFNLLPAHPNCRDVVVPIVE